MRMTDPGLRLLICAVACSVVCSAGPVGQAYAAEAACSGSACSGDSGCGTSPFSSAIDLLCSLDDSGACTTRCGCCQDELSAPFAGVTLGPPAATPATWPGLGGKGRIAAETELCLLRDLGKLPGKGFAREAKVDIPPLGQAKVAQRVGYLDFDPVTKMMQGFHGVSVCVPAFGCLDNQVQRFTATLVSEPVAPSAGLNCGDYPFAGSYALRMAATDHERRLDVELPTITVVTPYGTVEPAPKFHYQTALKSGFPTDINYDNDLAQGCPHGSDLYPLEGLATSASAIDFLCAVLPRPTYQPGFGHVGQIALGSRSADPGVPLYTPGTPRPDLDLITARTTDEKMPVGDLSALVRIPYNVAGLLPGKFQGNPFTLRAEAFVEPKITTRFASQFQVYGSDGLYQATSPLPGDCSIAPYSESRVDLRSRAEAFVSFVVVAGLDLVLKLNGFGPFDITVTLLEKHPKFDAVPPVDKQDDAEGPVAHAEARFDALPAPGFGSLTSFSAGPVADHTAFINECFATPPPEPGTPPTPGFTPDDPGKLTTVLEFPCNVCIGWGGLNIACGPAQGFPPNHPCEFTDGKCTDPAEDETGVNGCTTYPVTAADLPVGISPNEVSVMFPTAGQTWLCDAPEKTGCFDLCTYDPTSSQPLKVVRSAVELDPDRCGASTGTRVCVTDAECDDANPCTADTCSGSEIGYCRYEPQDGACNDGLWCNGADRCALGVCGMHDGNPCVSAQDCCDEGADRCVDSCPVALPRCGNGLLQPGELCDDGNLADGDGCSSVCLTECGNGTIDPNEGCDDGNITDGDGCSSICQFERTPPDCGTAYATTTELWPPNHQYVNVAIAGVLDAAGQPVTVTVTGIRQDEPLNGVGDGDTCPDADGVGSAAAKLRAERAGTAKVPGDGRVYHVAFTGVDGQGAQCAGEVTVCVPHDQRPGHACVDGGPQVDSTGPCQASPLP